MECIDACSVQTIRTDVSPVRMAHTQAIRGFRPWKDFVHDNFPWLEMRNYSNEDFRAEVGFQSLGDGALTTINVGASEVHRTRHLADVAEASYIKLIWQMAGRLELEQDRQRCLIQPGQAAVCDTARPYRIRMTEGAHFAVLMLPSEICPGWEKLSQQVCGRSIKDAAAIHAAVNALAALEGSIHRSDAPGSETVLRAVHWMLSSTLHRSAATPECGTRSAGLEKAQRHILERLGDPGLDANALASALCMSRRALYMLFQKHSLTPARMIQDIRLERCREALSDPRNQHRKITDIAFDHGFSDYATFSRVFKSHCGVAPSDYRLRRASSRH